jgi:hypothetical protein
MSTQLNVEGYWVGPYDVLVSNGIKKVVQEDGCNTLYKDGSCTEMAWQETMTKQDYLTKYAELREDGLYYYVK